MCGRLLYSDVVGSDFREFQLARSSIEACGHLDSIRRVLDDFDPTFGST